MLAPWLVADIGGTNARFGLVERPGTAPVQVRVLAGRDYSGLTEAALDYLGDVRPAAACLAVAAPISQGRFRMNNAPWSGSADQLRLELGLDHVSLINDFEALALSLPYLSDSDLRRIGASGSPVADAPLAVLGPGTGLGAAMLLPVPGGWRAVAGEGGHVDIPVVDDLEIEVMRLLRAEHGSGSAELLLSGAGLVRLHRLLALINGVRPEPVTPAELCACPTDPQCLATLRLFCAFLGSFSANTALTLGARGGVFLGGGILPRIADVLEASDFRVRFESKPPVQDYLRAIPTSLIVAATPALAGAAARLTLEYA